MSMQSLDSKTDETLKGQIWGREPRLYVTKEEALELIGNRDTIPTLMDVNGRLTRVDWSRNAIDDALDNADAIRIAGAQGKLMGYGLLIDNFYVRFLFVQVDAQRLEYLEKQIIERTIC